MTTTYTTQEGDLLDWICWRYYVIGRLPFAGSSSTTGQTLAPFTNTQNASTSGIDGIIESVLAVNPGLAAHTILPPGIQILLPDVTAQTLSTSVTHLWD